MIHGIGIDLVRIKRLREADEKWGRKFFEKILTEKEIAYCYEKRDPFPSLAVRFAAKEALIKAIGSDISVRMKDVEISNDERGRPSLQYSGPLKEFCESKAIRRSHLSLTHEREYGIACVVLET